MKKFLLVLGMAMAALTMPLKASYCDAPCGPCGVDPCCDYDAGFNGFYIGGNLGVFTHTAFRNDFDGFIFAGADRSGFAFNQTDFTVGVQLGYDWLCNYKLFGLVVDWNWVNVDHRNSLFDVVDSIDGSTRHRFNWFTTIRARAGLAICDALVYVTAGAAVTNFDNRWESIRSDILVADRVFDFNRTRWGWVGGVGTELILGCNWSVGAEVLFLQFAQRRTTVEARVGTGEVVTPFRLGLSDAGYVARFLLNYRFGDLCGCW